MSERDVDDRFAHRFAERHQPVLDAVVADDLGDAAS
jgi:hypothetical protein